MKQPERSSVVLAACLSAATVVAIGAGAEEPAPTPASAPSSTEAPARSDAYYEFALSQVLQLRGDRTGAIAALERALSLDPDSATIHATLASVYLESSRWLSDDERVRRLDAARDAAARAVELSPDDAFHHSMAYEVYAELMRQTGDEIYADLALEAAMRARDLDPDGVGAELGLAIGRMLFRGGDYERARDVLGPVSRNSAQSSYWLARSLVELDAMEEAEEVLLHALSLSPSDPRSWAALASLYERESRFPEAAEAFRRLLSFQPDNAWARAHLAEALLESGDGAAALDITSDLLRSRGDDVYILSLHARAAELVGDDELAVTSYQTAIEMRPIDADVRIRLARLLSRLGRSDEAVQAYGELAALHEQMEQPEMAALAAMEGVDAHPEFDALRIGLIRSLVRIGDLERALATARSADEGGSDDPGRFGLITAELLMRLERTDEALAQLDGLLGVEAEPEDYLGAAQVTARVDRMDETLRILFGAVAAHPEHDGLLFALGAQLERERRYDEAELYLKRAIAVNPEHAVALNYLGYMLADLGLKLEYANELIDRALVLDGDNGAYLDSLGWVMFRLGRYQEAEAALLKALEQIGEDPEIHEHLAILYDATERPGLAREFWASAVDLGLEPPPEVVERLAAPAGITSGVGEAP